MRFISGSCTHSESIFDNNRPFRNRKSCCSHDLCRCFPNGVLYYEVTELSFLHKIWLRSVHQNKTNKCFDLALGYLSDKYIHYLWLPKSLVDSAPMVMQILREVAKSYIQKHGVVPVLFIDSADLLAKYNKVLFSWLITQAKQQHPKYCLHE